MDTKASTVEVVLPEISSVFEKAESEMSFEVYDPKITDGEEILKNNIVKMLLGEPFEEQQVIAGCPDYHLENPLIELHNVVDADSSQIEAMEMARSGMSFVLQRQRPI